MLTPQRAQELLAYDRLSGALTWKNARGSRAAGSLAGCLRHDGYVLLRIDGVRYPAHRVAWLLHYGAWPCGGIDHINRNPADNRIENLRDVSRAGNQQNQQRAQRTNTVGKLGVSPSPKSTGYRARIFVKGKEKHIGVFDTPDEAHRAYIKAKRKHHPTGVL
jgi:hypothetical protein